MHLRCRSLEPAPGRPLGCAFALGLALSLGGCAAPASLGSHDRALVANRTFVVTGASSGLGRGVAIKLGSYRANVVLAARRTEVLEGAARAVRAAGGRALVVTTDISRPEQVERLAQAAVARFGRIDVWINNAAVGAIGRFEEVPIEVQARIVDVNLKGVIYGSHAALRRFRAQGFGTLVNISSVEGRIPLAYQATYAATKHAIMGLDAAIYQELRLDGATAIRVVTVLPWAIDTPWYQHVADYSGHAPRMAMLEGPEETVDGVVWVSIHPRKEYPVGVRAQGAVIADQLWPGLAEYFAAEIAHREIESAPPEGPTPGAVLTPMPEGTTVEGGTRARIEREDGGGASGR